MKDSPCLDRFVSVTISPLRHGFTTWLVFELCHKDITHTKVIGIRGAVSYSKDRRHNGFKALLLSQSPFCTLPYYLVAQVSSGLKPSKLSPSTACDLYASLRNYSDCSKRVDTWSSIKTAGQRGFFAKAKKALLLLSVCLKSFCSTLPQCLAQVALKLDEPSLCTCQLRWRHLTGREIWIFYFSDMIWHMCVLASILKTCSSPAF